MILFRIYIYDFKSFWFSSYKYVSMLCIYSNYLSMMIWMAEGLVLVKISSHVSCESIVITIHLSIYVSTYLSIYPFMYFYAVIPEFLYINIWWEVIKNKCTWNYSFFSEINMQKLICINFFFMLIFSTKWVFKLHVRISDQFYL